MTKWLNRNIDAIWVAVLTVVLVGGLGYAVHVSLQNHQNMETTKRQCFANDGVIVWDSRGMKCLDKKQQYQVE